MPSNTDVFRYIQEHGPTVPNALRQALKLQDNFVSGALLSELVDGGKLGVTYLNHGTSKFYYDVDHPETLESVSQFLNEKDQRAWKLLQQEKVVKAEELTPLLRVAMANIKDYSRELVLQTPAGDQIYWRYYLLSEDDAIELVKQKYFGMKKEQQEARKSEKIEERHEEKPEKPKQEEKQTLKQEEKLVSEHQESLPKTSEQKKPKKHTIHAEKSTPSLSEGFAKRVHDQFEKKGIALIAVVTNTKTDFAATVTVKSSVGPVEYYCKAKAKKTTNDGDLATAVLEAQHHNLPLLYIADILSKKAQELQKTIKGVTIIPWE